MLKHVSLAALLGMSACAGGQTPEDDSGAAKAGGMVDGPQARALVEGGALLLDVRTPEEYAAGHVPGAVNIPVQVLESRMAEVPAGRDVVVYCGSGRRSAKASELLVQAGRGPVYDLGGMDNWR